MKRTQSSFIRKLFTVAIIMFVVIGQVSNYSVMGKANEEVVEENPQEEGTPENGSTLGESETAEEIVIVEEEIVDEPIEIPALEDEIKEYEEKTDAQDSSQSENNVEESKEGAKVKQVNTGDVARKVQPRTGVVAEADSVLTYTFSTDGTKTATVTGTKDAAYAGDLVIPSKVLATTDGEEYTVTKIGAMAFYKDTGRTFTGSLVFPSTITEIEDYAFTLVNGFTGDIVIPSTVKKVGDYAFYCFGSYKKPINGNVTVNSETISEQAFYGSVFTGSLTIGPEVKDIGEYSFSYTGFTGDFVLPSTVTLVNKYAFYYFGYYGKVQNVDINCSLPKSNVFQSANINGKVTFGPNVAYIGTEAFRQVKNATGDLVLPSTVKGVGTYAFREFGVNGKPGNLTVNCDLSKPAVFYRSGFTGALTIGESVKTIETQSFYQATGFTGDLVLPSTLSLVKSWAFYQFGTVGRPNNLTVNCNLDETAVFQESGFTGTLTIGNSVKTLAKQSFRGATSFSGDLVLPETLTYVGEFAFEKFGTVGSLNNLTVNCNLDEIAAFRESGFTGTLTLGNAVKTIGHYAFAMTKFTGDLALPSSIEYVGEAAFHQFGKNATVKPRNLFVDCDLTERSIFYESGFTGTLSFGENVEHISGIYIFAFCDFTGELVIPETIKTFHGRAYEGCLGISNVIHKKLMTLTGSLPDVNTPPVGYPEVSGYESTAQNYSGDVMLQSSAKWTNDALNEAELRVDFARSKLNTRLDYVFVLDYSDSMLVPKNISGTDDKYPRSLIMEDILSDAYDMILEKNGEGYDNRIALTAFGTDSLWSTDGFLEDGDALRAEKRTLIESNYTNYSEGLLAAKELIDNREDTSREAVIIFITDGIPNVKLEDGTKLPKEECDGVAEAAILRDAGVRVYPLGIASIEAEYEKNLKDISFDNETFYLAKDDNEFTELLSEAIQYINEDELPITSQVEVDLSKYFDFLSGTDADIDVLTENSSARIEGNKLIWDIVEAKSGTVNSVTVQLKLRDGKEDATGNLPVTASVVGDKIAAKNHPKLNRYYAYHEFVSVTKGKELPESIKNMAPEALGAFRTGTTVHATEFSSDPIVIGEDRWIFQGWSTTSTTLENSNYIFAGAWKCERDDYQVVFEKGDSGILVGDDNKEAVTIDERVLFNTSVSYVPVVKPNERYKFVGWLLKGTEDVYSSEKVKQMLITEDVTFIAQYEKLPEDSKPNVATSNTVNSGDTTDVNVYLLLGLVAVLALGGFGWSKIKRSKK
ncbi:MULTISPECIES: leucine-rich repeat protein [Breznakia]|uniref:Leucine rich repeat (LRR) protein n=1 Tax=Breznakia blatticola TaxID=1754012 RepID=A0A4R7ZQI5_9FIRM|nr:MULTISPECIES: leucine-rich repeat protein [Breznakia]MDH6367499.1 hypothetical protein [Breznakia sp. PH1-1]MDH6404619.1 hypothetical protein [Breznakia sp. PF1-11]MDH6412328.1 hypothetical protein [Breznakia sp. PFB1-11]MDH6414666.1 hypothetical protein [Breznakia sp. PFB1-14]MDH6416939.1 hypothetical protein [Breznakia sp. PFB1-4]